MCLTLKTPNILTASENIPVIKVLKRGKDGKIHSPIFPGIWEPGLEYHEELTIIPYGFGISNEYRTLNGFHSFSGTNDPELCKAVMGIFADNLEVWKAEISKGSKYVQEGNKFCSNSLRIISRIK